MSAPAIPAGYRRLRVGEKLTFGCKWCDMGEWENTFFVGKTLSKGHVAMNGPYIAPVARKGGKKGKKL